MLVEPQTQTVQAAAKLRLKWDAAAGIQARAVARGLRRRSSSAERRADWSAACARQFEQPPAMAKRNACGCRDRECFRAPVLFLCGGLDLSPEPAFPRETRQTRAKPARPEHGAPC